MYITDDNTCIHQTSCGSKPECHGQTIHVAVYTDNCKGDETKCSMPNFHTYQTSDWVNTWYSISSDDPVFMIDACTAVADTSLASLSIKLQRNKPYRVAFLWSSLWVVIRWRRTQTRCPGVLPALSIVVKVS